jgi:hypothetical protein
LRQQAGLLSHIMQNAKLDWYLTTIVKTQFRPTASPLVSDALDRIARTGPMPHSQPLQLLALRRYLRIQNREHRDLAALWTWTAEQTNASLNTLPNEDGAVGVARLLMNEAARVQRAFASANPGYTLGISPPRDLERQVVLWNRSLSIRVTGRELFDQAVNELAKPVYELPAQLSRVSDFARWLQDFLVTIEPGNAAPGTSDHGQMRAVDFIVMQGRTVIAGTERATIATMWTAPGWTRRLAAATAGTQLVGPLAHPYEPWHWSLR